MKTITRIDRRILIRELEERLLIKWRTENPGQQPPILNKKTGSHPASKKNKQA